MRTVKKVKDAPTQLTPNQTIHLTIYNEKTRPLEKVNVPYLSQINIKWMALISLQGLTRPIMLTFSIHDLLDAIFTGACMSISLPLFLFWTI